MRIGRGRAQDWDTVIVGYISLYGDTNPLVQEGCVSPHLEFHSVFLNGAYGYMTGPHQSHGYLKHDANMDKLRMWVRANLPAFHPLVVAGWHELPVQVHALAAPATDATDE